MAGSALGAAWLDCPCPSDMSALLMDGALKAASSAKLGGRPMFDVRPDVSGVPVVAAIAVGDIFDRFPGDMVDCNSAKLGALPISDIVMSTGMPRIAAVTPSIIAGVGACSSPGSTPRMACVTPSMTAGVGADGTDGMVTEMTFGLLAIDVEMDGASMPRLMPDREPCDAPERLENVCATGSVAGVTCGTDGRPRLANVWSRANPGVPGTLDSGFPIAANVASMTD